VGKQQDEMGRGVFLGMILGLFFTLGIGYELVLHRICSYDT
jgi:hypothetical protein